MTREQMNPGLILIRGVEAFAPESLGKMNILIGGSRIIAISPDPIQWQGIETKEIDGTGLKAFPGLIDAHIHIAGAGGEGGPATRTPEIMLTDILKGGITTVIGCLGTDGLTRSVESVLMKVKALREEGISAWMYSGAYQVPPPGLTGDPGRDVALIEEVIGIGEIAISDHRSSYPSKKELIRLAAHARVGGMLGGKAGIVNIHMGDARNPFQPIIDAVESSELPYTQFFPTHCNRNECIFEDAKHYGKQGIVDLTSSSYPYFPEYEIKPSEAVVQLIDAGVPLANITMTSDANGSLPQFDENGELIRLEMGRPESLLREFRDLVNGGFPPDQAIQIFSTNPASVLRLKRKGRLAENMDADLCLLDDKLEIVYLLSMGKIMVENADHKAKGKYE